MRFAFLALLLVAVTGCRFEARPAAEDPAPAPAAAAPGEFSDSLVETTTPDGKPAVVLYVTEWCPYCAQAREFMDAEPTVRYLVDPSYQASRL